MTFDRLKHEKIAARRKRAVLYARFSPRPNAAECESCTKQLEELRAWCVANDYEIVGEFQDAALSGGDDWDERPGMLDATTAAKRGMTFLVRSYDRMFRDTRKALTCCSMLEAKGVIVVSITEPAANGHDPMADMVRTIMLAIAEYQRALIRARTKAKMLKYQAEGRAMSDRPPWGKQHKSKWNKKVLIDNPDEITTTEMIVHRHRSGDSLRQIAKWLEAHGRERRGKLTWPHVIVKRILIRAGEIKP